MNFLGKKKIKHLNESQVLDEIKKATAELDLDWDIVNQYWIEYSKIHNNYIQTIKELKKSIANERKSNIPALEEYIKRLNKQLNKRIDSEDDESDE